MIRETVSVPCPSCRVEAIDVTVVVDPGEEPTSDYPGFPVTIRTEQRGDCRKCGAEVDAYAREIAEKAIEVVEENERAKGNDARWDAWQGMPRRSVA